MFLKEEYCGTDSETETSQNSQQAPVQTTVVQQPKISTLVTPMSGVPIVVDEVVKKMYGILKKINKPGIDFMELWDSAEAMGGTTVPNLQNAYKTLKIVATDLTLDKLTNDGTWYKNELARMVDEDVTQRRTQSQNLSNQKDSEKRQLTSEVDELTKQINQLQQQLLNKQQNLTTIDSKYDPEIKEIDQKISAGTTALGHVQNAIDDVIEKIKQIS